MYFEDLPEEEEKKPEREAITSPAKEYPRAPEYEIDCNVCGGSGPCFACDRGRELARVEIAKSRQKKKKRKEAGGGQKIAQ